MKSCGAGPGRGGEDGPHVEAGRALARELHKNGAHIVYGGGTHGMMGSVAKELVRLSGPQSVHGIIPKPLLGAEAEGKIDPSIFGKLTVVKSMHERKMMFKNEVMAGGPGSAFVALSGGFGTLEELFEAIAWNQLSIHDKPVIIFNVGGIFDKLKPLIDDGVAEGFISAANKNIPVFADTPEEVMEKIRTYEISPGRVKLVWKDGQE